MEVLANNKETTNKSANFVTLKINFKSGVFEISGVDDDRKSAENSFASYLNGVSKEI